MSSLLGTLKLLSEIYPEESQLENQGLQGLKRDLTVAGVWEVGVSDCWWFK